LLSRGSTEDKSQANILLILGALHSQRQLITCHGKTIGIALPPKKVTLVKENSVSNALVGPLIMRLLAPIVVCQKILTGAVRTEDECVLGKLRDMFDG
jgi:hypothetical protein